MQASATVHSEPRDIVNAPAYRVNFWERPSDATGWNLDAHVLTDVSDVTEALQWVEANARGRRLELFVETDVQLVGPFHHPRTAGLARLLGSDPNAVESEISFSFTSNG